MRSSLRSATGNVPVRTFAALGLAASLFIVPSVAHGVVIDNFDEPSVDADWYLIWPAMAAMPEFDDDLHVMQYLGLGTNIVGTQRELIVDVTDLTVPVGATGVIGAGSYTFGSVRNAATVTLQYDGVDVETPGTPLTDAKGLTTDLTEGGTHSAIAFSFESIDGGAGTTLDVLIELTGPGGATASWTGSFAETFVPTVYTADYADFVLAGGFDFADVTSINITFNSTAMSDVDFELDTIQTDVPEPHALAMIGLSSLILTRRRRP